MDAYVGCNLVWTDDEFGSVLAGVVNADIALFGKAERIRVERWSTVANGNRRIIIGDGVGLF